MEDFIQHFFDDDKKVSELDLLRNGLLFTIIQPMPDFIDHECVSPSRNLLVKYLVENGASINY